MTELNVLNLFKLYSNSMDEKSFNSNSKILRKVFLFCITYVQFFTINAQTPKWTQLGPGAGGQERGIYLHKRIDGKFDLYVGSDVSGVWLSKDVDPLRLTNINSYNFNYISNHRIVRFINKFYHPDSYSSAYLFVGSRGGIDRIDLNNPTNLMKNITVPANFDMTDSWVSAMYLRSNKRMYFTTGNTRVSDLVNENYYKNNSTAFDFYYGELSSGEDSISSLNGIDFAELSSTVKHDVFCVSVKEATNQLDDQIMVGSEVGLFSFSFDSLVSNNLTSAYKTGPNGSTSYKVTSITPFDQDNDSLTPDVFLITVHDLSDTIGGLYLYDGNTWQNLITQLFGEKKVSTTCPSVYRDLAMEDSTRYFTNLLPLKNQNLIYGWLLLNENNSQKFLGDSNVCNQGPYYIGIFYSKADSLTQLPDGNWQALDVNGLNNDWGWNPTKPCGNINSATITSDNHLIIGKQGNIFVTGDSIAGAGTVDWLQIYTKNKNSSCNQAEKDYTNIGYVNTATLFIYPTGNNNIIWTCERDRQLSFLTDNDLYSKQVTQFTTCKNIVPNPIEDPCLAYVDTIIPEYRLTDAFFVMNNKFAPSDNNLYAGMAEGFGAAKGRGLIFQLNPSSASPTSWTQIGNAICGDPVKMLITQNGSKYALVKIFKTKLYYLNGNIWTPVNLFNNGNDNLMDAEINSTGDTLFLVNINKTGTVKAAYVMSGGGTSWTQVCSAFADSTGNTEPDNLLLLNYNDGNPYYKVWCGASPKSYDVLSSNLYEIYDSKGSVCKQEPINNPSGCLNELSENIFKSLNIDNLDQVDQGISALDFNQNTSTVYVSTVGRDTALSPPVLSHIYKASYDTITGTVLTGTCWEEVSGHTLPRPLPNKTILHIESRLSNACNEILYLCVRGLGPWKYEANPVTFIADSVLNVTCYDGNNGEAKAAAPSGFSNPVFLWSNGQTTYHATQLTAGSYTVTVYDGGSNCSASQNIIITQPFQHVISTSVIPAKCYGDSSGVATVIVADSLESYSYSWASASLQSSALATGLIAGVYTVTVTDNSGCTTTQSVTITQPSQIIVSSSKITGVTCSGAGNGAIDISTSGGAGNLSYLWNDSVYTSNRSNLQFGNYSVRISDTANCSSSSAFNVPLANIDSLIITNKINVNCNAAATGSISISGNGNTVPTGYLWNKGSTLTSITKLKVGTYTCTITFSQGCTRTKTVAITQNAALVILVTPFLPSSATASVSGGVAPFSYSWNTLPAKTTATVSGLVVGKTYKVKVTDSKGCTKTVSFVMPALKQSDPSSVEDEFNVSVYPNPTEGIISLKIINCNQCSYKISLFDFLGNEVYSEMKPKTNGNLKIETRNYNFSNLAKGLYFFKVDAGDKIKVLKIVLQ